MIDILIGRPKIKKKAAIYDSMVFGKDLLLERKILNSRSPGLKSP